MKPDEELTIAGPRQDEEQWEGHVPAHLQRLGPPEDSIQA